MPTTTQPTEKRRVIRFQFRRNGRVHLAEVLDQTFEDGSIHVSHPYVTLCGKRIPIGTGGWGYGQPMCTDCDRRTGEDRRA